MPVLAFPRFDVLTIARSFPVEGVTRTFNASLPATALDPIEPACREVPDVLGVPHRMGRHTKRLFNLAGSQGSSDLINSGFVHTQPYAKLVGFGQAKRKGLRQKTKRATNEGMDHDKPRPFSDIAARIKWHRSLSGMLQNEYAESIGAKRSALSLWEAGTHRLSLDGALALKNRYGLTLDFLYLGDDGSLPMTLRQAWESSPEVSSSK